MPSCSQCKALQGAEAQVMRHAKIVGELLQLLKCARDDGGLTSAQAEHLDRLASRAEAVLDGRDTGDDYQLLREVAVAVGPISDLDRETFAGEDLLGVELPFWLMDRIGRRFPDLPACVCSGDPEARTVATAVLEEVARG